MLLRFDDTNPSKEKEEYEQAIIRDLGRLGIKPYARLALLPAPALPPDPTDGPPAVPARPLPSPTLPSRPLPSRPRHAVSHTSDHFAKIKDLATKMIKEGKAYVDPSPQEEQQKNRFERKENEHRSASVETNLRLWDEMHKGSEVGRVPPYLVPRR